METLPFCLWSDDALSDNKLKTSSNPIVKVAFRALLRRADGWVIKPPLTITAKTKSPPSGDKRDYTSMGIYWWPNPATPSGLPYVNRDGQVNPEVHLSPDRDILDQTIDAICDLALAHHFTGSDKYKDAAVKRLLVFFLDPNKKMKPAMPFTQFIPGVTEGRGTGTVDAESLPFVCDSITLLARNGAFNQNTLTALRGWFEAFATWLKVSKIGREAAHAQNNIGAQYDGQVASYLRFAGKHVDATQFLDRQVPLRITNQVSPVGHLSLEVTRSKPWAYHCYGLNFLVRLALLRPGTWTERGRGPLLHRAIDVTAVYADGGKKWPYGSGIIIQPDKAFELLYTAGGDLLDQTLQSLAIRIVGGNTSAREILTTRAL